MSKRIIRVSLTFVLAWLLLPWQAAAGAPQAGGEAEVASLIERLGDKNEEQAMRAAHALTAMGPRVRPALAESLKRRKGCQFQFVASGIIYAIDKNEAAANSILADVAQGKCEGSSKNDRGVRRLAVFSLVTRAEGIPLVARLLKDRETFVRQSAAFAFDELTEKMGDARPDAVKVTPEMVAAVGAALPLLVEALGDQDEVVRCMSLEAMEQAQAVSSAELREEAARLMKGVKPRCSN
jgi:HEAT repeat protein